MFDENFFSYFQTTPCPSLSTLDISQFLEPFASPNSHPSPELSSPTTALTLSPICTICFNNTSESLQAPSTAPSVTLLESSLAPSTDPIVASFTGSSLATSRGSFHPMVTRAKAGIFKSRHLAFLNTHSTCLLHALLTHSKPKGFKFATKNPAWLATMDEDVIALHSNHT